MLLPVGQPPAERQVRSDGPELRNGRVDPDPDADRDEPARQGAITIRGYVDTPFAPSNAFC